jgi:L-iditol 2-dehydrogenase
MKALVKYEAGVGHVALREVSEPKTKKNEVLLEIGAVGICGTDLHTASGEYPCRPPVILGHEFAGTIVALGEGVSDWKIGDRVTSLPYAIVCHECRHCRAGEYGLCEKRLSYGTGVNGAFAKYLAVNASGIYRLPDHQDFVAGALSEPLACVARAVYKMADLQPADQVIVLGPGQIGLLTTQVAKAVGARVSLIGLKTDAARLDLGRQLGADHIYYAEDPDLPAKLNRTLTTDGADVAFECSGAGPAFDLAMNLVRRQGRLIQVGLFGKRVESDLDRIVFKELTVRGSFASSLESFDQAMRLTGRKKVDTGRLVSDVFPLEQWEKAFARASDRSGLKVVVKP